MNKFGKTAAILLTLTAVLSACSGSAGTLETETPLPSALTPVPTPTLSPSPLPSPSPSPSASVSPSPSPIASPAASPSPAEKTEAPAKATPAKSTDSSKKSVSWYYMKKKKGEVPNFPAETKQLKPNQKAVWVGTGKKVYLTFDTGGPMGDTEKMLKALKDNDVKANYFLAGYNVKANPDFVKQLVADGHLVANHTMTHTDMTTQSDGVVKKEIEDFAKMYTEITGKPQPKAFRFPYGTYSMHLLDLVSDMGYTSFFWSTAMRDWEPRKNGPDDSYNDIMNNLHDGNIILMHQGSEDNINALDKIIKGIKKEGYEFALLTDLMKE